MGLILGFGLESRFPRDTLAPNKGAGAARRLVGLARAALYTPPMDATTRDAAVIDNRGVMSLRAASGLRHATIEAWTHRERN